MYYTVHLMFPSAYQNDSFKIHHGLNRMFQYLYMQLILGFCAFVLK